MPHIELYQGTSNPKENLKTYIVMMQLHGAEDEILCQDFSTELNETERAWYHLLKPGYVDNFKDLSRQFAKHLGVVISPRGI